MNKAISAFYNEPDDILAAYFAYAGAISIPPIRMVAFVVVITEVPKHTPKPFKSLA